MRFGTVAFYGDYIYARLMNPSDSGLTGFPTIAEGIFIPPGQWNKGVYTNAAVTANAYNVQRALETGTGINISSNKCAGSQDAFSFLADWRPVQRVDVSAGVMLSNVYGGLASGYLHPQNVDPAAGIRIRFQRSTSILGGPSRMSRTGGHLPFVSAGGMRPIRPSATLFDWLADKRSAPISRFAWFCVKRARGEVTKLTGWRSH